MALMWIRKLALACVAGASSLAAIVALSFYVRAKPMSTGIMERKAEEEEPGQEAEPQASKAQPAPGAQAESERDRVDTFPLRDLPRDALVAALELLSAADLSKAAGASRLLFLIVGDVQRRPSLVTEVGTPSEVMASIGLKLAATPTLGFLFSTGDLRDRAIAEMLAKRIPLSCDIIGARTSQLQALVQQGSEPDAPATPGPGAARATQTKLRALSERGRIAMQLGSFPEAEARSFHIPDNLCTTLARADGDAAAQNLLRQWGCPVGDEWKTIVLIAGSVSELGRVINAFQSGHPGTAIIGGIAERQLLIHARGNTRVEDNGVAGLALKGDVPLTALVSRGCSALTPPFRTRGARLLAAPSSDDDGDEGVPDGGREPEQVLFVPELVAEDGSSVKPIQVATQAQRNMRPIPMMFVGSRFGRDSGFLLEQLTNNCFGAGGSLLLDLQGTPPAGDVSDSEICFYSLDADESKKDLRRLLGHVKAQCERNGDQMMGALMFTCGGRGRRFFGADHVDAKEFQESFPSVTLAGFWAGGEIGPQALADAAPEQATRTGRAALQGFTAVFGIFRAPLPTARSWLIYRDEEVPAAVGQVFARLAREAKARADAAVASREPAHLHLRRAAALAAVPSAVACLPEALQGEILAAGASPAAA